MGSWNLKRFLLKFIYGEINFNKNLFRDIRVLKTKKVKLAKLYLYKYKNGLLILSADGSKLDYFEASV